VLSTCLDEDGRAKILLGIDDSDEDGLVESTGAEARERRKARAKNRAAAAPKPAAAPPLPCKPWPATGPAARKGAAKAAAKAAANANLFARPAQISLDADGFEVDDKKDKKDKKEKPRSRSRPKKKTRAQRLMEAADAMDPSLLSDSWRRAAGMPVNRAAGNDLTTGGTSIGPMSMGLTDPSQAGKTGICMKFIGGRCQMTSDTCPQKHPSDPAERMKWIRYFNTQPCKYGDKCTIETCIYEHPNRPGWSGENVNLLQGSAL